MNNAVNEVTYDTVTYNKTTEQNALQRALEYQRRTNRILNIAKSTIIFRQNGYVDFIAKFEIDNSFPKCG